MQHEIITSIDFGSKKISASMATNDKNGEMDILGVMSCKSTGIEKGCIIDTDKCRNDVFGLIKDLEIATKEKVGNVCIGISARNIIIRETLIIFVVKLK